MLDLSLAIFRRPAPVVRQEGRHDQVQAHNLRERAAEYEYAVEDKQDDVGRVLLDLGAGTCEVTKLAPTDEAVGYAWYGSKMRHALELYRKTGQLRESGTISWY